MIEPISLIFIYSAILSIVGGPAILGELPNPLLLFQRKSKPQIDPLPIAPSEFGTSITFQDLDQITEDLEKAKQRLTRINTFDRNLLLSEPNEEYFTQREHEDTLLILDDIEEMRNSVRSSLSRTEFQRYLIDQAKLELPAMRHSPANVRIVDLHFKEVLFKLHKTGNLRLCDAERHRLQLVNMYFLPSDACVESVELCHSDRVHLQLRRMQRAATPPTTYFQIAYDRTICSILSETAQLRLGLRKRLVLEPERA